MNESIAFKVILLEVRKGDPPKDREGDQVSEGDQVREGDPSEVREGDYV